MERFFPILLVHGADDHAAGVDAHHCTWWQVGDGNQGFADEFFRFVVFVNAAEDGSINAGAVIEGELKEFLALRNSLAIQYFYCTEVAFGEGFEVYHVFEEWFYFNAGKVDFFYNCIILFFLFRCLFGLWFVEWLHSREEQYVTDGFCVGKEHNHTVNPNPKATGWWQAVFEGLDEVVIHWMGFVVTLAFCFNLFFEALALVDWVVQFRECIGMLAADDEEFKTVGEVRIGALAACQWGDFYRVVGDKGWLD